MPFKSFAQESFLKHRHPGIYRRWLNHYGHYKGKKKHVSKSAHVTKEGGMNFLENVVETVQLAGAALQKSEQELEKRAAADRRYLEKVAEAVSECVRYNKIDDTPEEHEKLAEWLSTPEGALEVVMKLAQHTSEPPTVPTMGQPVDSNGRTKSASASNRSCYVGRRTAEEPEAWKTFAANLGIS
jgi:hypothetical protein